MAEYYNVMLRSGQNDHWIQENLEIILGYVRLQPLNETVMRRAWHIRNRYGFSIWDSQIIAAALVSGCDTLYLGRFFMPASFLAPLARTPAALSSFLLNCSPCNRLERCGMTFLM
jgi:hypothetical protein